MIHGSDSRISSAPTVLHGQDNDSLSSAVNYVRDSQCGTCGISPCYANALAMETDHLQRGVCFFFFGIERVLAGSSQDQDIWAKCNIFVQTSRPGTGKTKVVAILKMWSHLQSIMYAPLRHFRKINYYCKNTPKTHFN
jgi:hypothetical protein